MAQDEAEPDRAEGGSPVGEQSADPARSGGDVVEAVERASAGTPHGGVERPPEQAKPQAAPVEQVRDDPDMTGRG